MFPSAAQVTMSKPGERSLTDAALPEKKKKKKSGCAIFWDNCGVTQKRKKKETEKSPPCTAVEKLSRMGV